MSLFRWFRHISDASNAYKNRQGDRARGGSVGGGIGRHGSRLHGNAAGGEENGLLGSSMGVGLPGEPGGGGSNLGKSHSFHERSTSEAARAAADNDDKRDDVLSKTGKA